MTYKDIKIMFRGMNIPFSNLMQKLLHKLDLDTKKIDSDINKIDSDINKINKNLNNKVNKEDLNIPSIVEQSIPSVIEQAIPKVAEEIVPTLDDRYVQFDKKYPKLTAGFAENLISDDASTEEEFIFRPTAGEERNVVNTTYYNGERNGVARIEKIKGTSVVWNQCCGQGGRGDARISWENNILTINGEFTSDYSVYDTMSYDAIFKSAIANHKYYILVELVSGTINDGEIMYYINPLSRSFPLSANKKIEILSNVTSSGYWFTRTLSAGTNCENAKIKHTIYDLTQIFDVGNEPTTVEEFYKRIPKGIDINAYNEGEIINGNYGKLKTTGYNQWDEQWNVGAIDGKSGVNIKSDNDIRSKNYIPALANTKYFFHVGRTCSIIVCCYDDKYNFLGTIAYATDINRTYTTLPNTSYIRFSTYFTGNVNYGNVYQNDICISLDWNEYAHMKGVYFPYKPFIRDLSWIKKYFPDGMRSAGSVHDEIRFNFTTQKWEAVQRINVVDAGNLHWEYYAPEDRYTYGFFISNSISNKKKSESNIISSRYVTIVNFQTDKVIFGNTQVVSIYIIDSAYTDATTFKTAMQGVMLNYELEEPIVTEITEDVNMDFDVFDYGVEELITSENLPSVPFKADIIYALDAFYTLKNVPDILKDIKLLKSELENLKNANNTNIEEE